MTELAFTVAAIAAGWALVLLMARRRPKVGVMLPRGHGFQPGDHVSMSMGDPSYDGVYQVAKATRRGAALRPSLPGLAGHALVAYSAVMATSTVAEVAGWTPAVVSWIAGWTAGFCLLVALVAARRPG